MIRVFLNVPSQLRECARSIFIEFALRWGVGVQFVSESDQPHIVYGSSSLNNQSFVLISCDEKLYQPETNCAIFNRGDRQYWGVARTESNALPDIVGGSFRLLTLLDEKQIPESLRDARGLFLVRDLPDELKRDPHLPLVELMADWLKFECEKQFPKLFSESIPRWKDGKKQAAVLSHDVDAVNLGGMLEIAANGLKGLLKRNPIDLRMMRDGLVWLGRSKGNPLDGFQWWFDFERLNNVRSTFYVYIRPLGIPFESRDCRSSLGRRDNRWTLLHQMVTERWEIGAHPSLMTRYISNGLQSAKSEIERMLELPITGVRHHYLAVNWDDPIETFKAHMAAGYLYDSSIAWRDLSGYRSGTSLPYRPIDIVSGKRIDFWELPMQMMDVQFFEGMVSEDEAEEVAQSIIEQNRQIGGTSVFNWHQETAVNDYRYSRYIDKFKEIVVPLFRDSDIWWTTATELVEYWQARERVILKTID